MSDLTTAAIPVKGRPPSPYPQARAVSPGLWEDVEAETGGIKWSCFREASTTLNLKKTKIMEDGILCPHA